MSKFIRNGKETEIFKSLSDVNNCPICGSPCLNSNDTLTMHENEKTKTWTLVCKNPNCACIWSIHVDINDNFSIVGGGECL